VSDRDLGADEPIAVPEKSILADRCERRNGMVEIDHAHQEVAKGVPLVRVVAQEDVVVLEGRDRAAVQAAPDDIPCAPPIADAEWIGLPVVGEIATTVDVVQAVFRGEALRVRVVGISGAGRGGMVGLPPRVPWDVARSEWSATAPAAARIGIRRG
jgi:hypothetical protein